MIPAEDQKIFEAIRLDDRHAFEQVFRESYRPLKAYAFRFVSDLSIAENIVQDVFLKLWTAGKILFQILTWQYNQAKLLI